MEIPNKRELQQIASNCSSGSDLKDFMRLYRHYYTKEPFSSLVSNKTLPSDNSLRFRKNVL